MPEQEKRKVRSLQRKLKKQYPSDSPQERKSKAIAFLKANKGINRHYGNESMDQLPVTPKTMSQTQKRFKKWAKRSKVHLTPAAGPGSVGEARLAEMARSATELRDELKSFGGDPTGLSRKELEAAIAQAKWAKSHPNEPFPDQYDPMLAKDATKSDKAWVQSLSPKDYILQLKVNGLRSILRIDNGKVWMTSRQRSVEDNLFTPHHEKVLGFIGFKDPFSGKTVLDGELFSPKAEIDTGATVTKSPLQAAVAIVHAETSKALSIQKKFGSLAYHAFDLLFFEGESVQDKPYEDRLALLMIALAKIKETNPECPISMVPTITDFTDAYQVWQEFLGQGHEGIMVKTRKGKYQQGARSSELMKLKGFVDIDAFVTGFVPSTEGKGHEDYIGGLEFSTYVDGKETVIAAVSNIPMDVRKDATIKGPDGKPTLNPEWRGKCAALVGQEFGKNMRLGSARVEEWRPDKNPEDCQVKAEDIMPKDWKQTEATAVEYLKSLSEEDMSKIAKDLDSLHKNKADWEMSGSDFVVISKDKKSSVLIKKKGSNYEVQGQDGKVRYSTSNPSQAAARAALTVSTKIPRTTEGFHPRYAKRSVAKQNTGNWPKPGTKVYLTKFKGGSEIVDYNTGEVYGKDFADVDAAAIAAASHDLIVVANP